MVALLAVAHSIVLHLSADRVLIRKSASRVIEALLPDSFGWKNRFAIRLLDLYYFPTASGRVLDSSTSNTNLGQYSLQQFDALTLGTGVSNCGKSEIPGYKLFYCPRLAF